MCVFRGRHGTSAGRGHRGPMSGGVGVPMAAFAGIAAICEVWYISVHDRHRWPASDGWAPQREDTADKPGDAR